MRRSMSSSNAVLNRCGRVYAPNASKLSKKRNLSLGSYFSQAAKQLRARKQETADAARKVIMLAQSNFATLSLDDVLAAME